MGNDVRTYGAGTRSYQSGTPTTNNYSNITIPTDYEVTNYAAPEEMTLRKEKLRLYEMEKNVDLTKKATIISGIATAAMAAFALATRSSLGLTAMAGVVSLLGGISWYTKKKELDAMINAYSAEGDIKDRAQGMKQM